MALGNALREVFNDAVDVSYVPEFVSEQTPEARAREIEELQYNLATQEGGAASAGLIASDHAGEDYYIDENGNRKKGNKADKVEDLLIRQALMEGLDNMLDDMSGMIDDMRDNDRKIRKGISNFLDGTGQFQTYPSDANFVLAKVFNIKASELRQKLEEKDIKIKSFNNQELSNHIRVSIGSRNDIECLKINIQNVLNA